MKNISNTFVTSDLHFGHKAVIEYCNRPFKSVEEMDETLIKNWNKVVKPIDKVYVLGDFFMYHKKPKLREIMSRLNGTKILVLGNHDMSDREMESIGFSFVCRSATINLANELVNLSHFPYKRSKLYYLFWDTLHKLFPKRFFRPRRFHYMLEDDGKYLLHGHTHGKDKVTAGKMIHVGVDAWNYTPVPLQKIADIIGKLKKGEIIS